MIEQSKESGFTLRWLLQAGLGILLVVLLAIHLIVNHWVAPHGLLGYPDIIRYYDQPGVDWMEAVFLIVVTIHCLLGIHAIILDLALSPGITRGLTQILILLGVMILLYGLWLISSIRSLSAV